MCITLHALDARGTVIAVTAVTWRSSVRVVMAKDVANFGESSMEGT